MKPYSKHHRDCLEADRLDRWAGAMKRELNSIGADHRWIGGVDVNRPLPHTQADLRKQALRRYDEVMKAHERGVKPSPHSQPRADWTTLSGYRERTEYKRQSALREAIIANNRRRLQGFGHKRG